MKTRQRGVTLMGLIVGLFILVVVALFGMKVIPHYMEYFTAKGAIEAIARERQALTPADVRRAFNARAAIDNINAVKAEDLEIGKEGNDVTIAFAYRREVPLAGNVGLYIDFVADTRGQ